MGSHAPIVSHRSITYAKINSVCFLLRAELKEGAALAAQSVESSSATRKLEALVRVSQKLVAAKM